MSEEFSPATSPQRILIVYEEYPHLVFTVFNFPQYGKAGETVTISGEITNDGAGSGAYNLLLMDVETGDVLATKAGSIGVGASVPFSWSLTMPDKNWRLRAQALHSEPVEGWVVDDQKSFTITLTLLVTTTLTLTLSPDRVSPGGTYTYSGRLTRTDTGEGIGGMTILLQRYVGVWDTKATITTASNGTYSGSIAAPHIIGDYSCRAVFEGTALYAASQKSAVLGVLEAIKLEWWQWGLLIGWAILGGVGIGLGRKR